MTNIKSNLNVSVKVSFTYNTFKSTETGTEKKCVVGQGKSNAQTGGFENEIGGRTILGLTMLTGRYSVCESGGR